MTRGLGICIYGEERVRERKGKRGEGEKGGVVWCGVGSEWVGEEGKEVGEEMGG